MKLSQTTDLQQTQKLVITPELRQGIEILHYTSAELMQHIHAEMLDNPLIEVDDAFEKMAKSILDNYATDQPQRMYSKDDFWANKDDDLAAADTYTAKQDTLIEHLKAQLGLAGLSQNQQSVAAYIIEMISPTGYFDIDVVQLSQIYGITEDDIEDLICTLQTFDPIGTCARSLSECLAAQLKVRMPYNLLAIDIAEHYLEYIAGSKLTELAGIYACKLSDIQSAVDLIKSLNPKPGLQFAGNQPVNYVFADVEVKRDGDEFIILVNESSAPKLHINAYYKQILKQNNVTKDTKHYLNQKMARVLRLIKSIEQRRSTIYNVMASMIKHQPDFFSGNISFLNPLRLKDIAEDVGVHASTVSRAINGKYVQTPMGVFAFRHFLQSSVAQNNGEGISAENIKRMMCDLIHCENPKKPLSDQKIVNAMKEKNIDVSRRTVTKYRESMGIVNSNKRKRY